MDNAQLKEDILSVFKPIITSWTEPDIYVISFLVNNYCDNPCEPTVTLGYNTEHHYQTAIAKASSKDEARWNFAFWLPTSEFVFGEGTTKENVANWIKNNNMPYYPCVDFDFDIPDDVDNKLLNQITKEFVYTLIEIVKELHSTGFIKEKFGKPIPIIIHELEYYAKIADQNIEANTLPLIGDFVDWVRGS